jgi:maltooligosyltrehalose trehalohydrolase
MDLRCFGARLDATGATFRTWAPEHARVEVVLLGSDGSTEELRVPMRPEPDGFFSLRIAGLRAGQAYKLRVDDRGPWPDPFSRSQPFGVHGASVLVDEAFPWTDAGWEGVPLERLVIWEAHVGAATENGTFDSLAGRLGELRALGVTAVELMPVHAFPGRWNWGYDGVSWFAPSATYGGPAGLRRFVDTAHRVGLAVLLDVVFNHLGPSGNYLREYSRRYFTDRHRTPWGDALNLDPREAGPVREALLQNVELWIRDYHADGLRLDATHALFDDSLPHILELLASRARAAAPHRHVVVIAEDERNDPMLTAGREQGGFGLDAVWADDLHHALRRAFAGDRDGYFADYSGTAAELARTLDAGWLYDGRHSVFKGHARGAPAGDTPYPRFVHCIQNHDQVGNRALGDRLGRSVSPDAERAMAAVLLLAPSTPLLFMGQEWSASAPFQYFTDHDAELGAAVTRGRRAEFAQFAAFAGEVPDPQDPRTFGRSKLDWDERSRQPHAGMLAWYRDLLALRRNHPVLQARGRASFGAHALGEHGLLLERRDRGRTLALLVSIEGPVTHAPAGRLGRIVLTSDDPRYGGCPGRVRREGSALRVEGPAAVVFETA